MENKSDYHLYETYKNQLKREKKVVFAWQFTILVTFIALWELASRLYWIDPLIFSSPTKIFNLLIDRFTDGSMVTHIQVTLFETVLGFIIGTLLGIVIATLLWSSTRFSKIMDP